MLFMTWQIRIKLIRVFCCGVGGFIGGLLRPVLRLIGPIVIGLLDGIGRGRADVCGFITEMSVVCQSFVRCPDN